MNASTRLFIDVAAELCQQGDTPAQAVQMVRDFVAKHHSLVDSRILSTLHQASPAQALSELERRFPTQEVAA